MAELQVAVASTLLMYYKEFYRLTYPGLGTASLDDVIKKASTLTLDFETRRITRRATFNPSNATLDPTGQV